MRRERKSDLEFRYARSEDVACLAEMNAELIRDEGHRNRMSIPELEERMRGWLGGEYRAVLFEVDPSPVAYALYRPDEGSIYLRQFFVRPTERRKGIGRAAVQLLRERVWPPGVRVILEVLVGNRSGLAFWRALGFEEYAVVLEQLDGSQDA